MAELVSIEKYDSPPQVGTPPQCAARVLVPPNSKGKEGAVWSANDGFDLSAVVSGTPSRGTGFHSRRPPVSLQWHNISLTTSNGKTILKGVSGSANTGELMAILGPSGAGKSTLLNVLSGFTRAKVDSRITVNGAPRDMRVFRKLSCYIMQDNHLLPNLTVRESIQLAARLKIPSSVSRQDREKERIVPKNRVFFDYFYPRNKVDDCMEALGLSERQNNKASQISGGQRKRLCIAQELVSNPPLIFLDEPTSGLDSSSSLQCVQLLKSLAKEGRTVICTIHQPSSRIFELFDKLYMLADGHCTYKGSTKNLIPFLSEQGLSCPTYHNPADFAMEVAAGEHGDWIWKLKTAIDTFDATRDVSSLAEESFIFNGSSEVGLQASNLCLLKDEVENNPSPLKENALENSFGDYATSSWNQFKVLTYRSLICTYREPMATKLPFFANVLIGLLMGILYYGIGNDASKILNNSGFLFFSLLFFIFTAMMPTLLTFPMEKTIFAREYINSWYSTRMYYLAKTVSEIPFQILFPVIYCSIVYWMTAQPNDIVRFGLFILSSIMISLVAQSVGLLIGAATSVQNAVFLGPVGSIPFLLFCGFFINLDTIPHYLQWLTYISYVRYCYQSMLRGIYGFDRPELHCDKNFCPFQEPQDFLREMGMADGNLYVDYAAMWAFFFVFRVIAYYVLYYKIIYKR